jgi:hypothetical protein
MSGLHSVGGDMTEPDQPQGKITTISTEHSQLTAEGDIEVIGTQRIVNKIDTFTRRALTAVEEAKQARNFAARCLAEGIQTFAKSLRDITDSDSGASDPYRGLLSYRLKDAEIFYGRNQAIKDFMRVLRRGSLTVLHAESGAGKTSLIHAGISPCLINAGDLPIYLRPNKVEPGLALKRTLVPNLEQVSGLMTSSLRDFLWQVSQVLGAETKIYIFLDQFEEFFALDISSQNKFVDALGLCLNPEIPNVYWVLSIRKEYFSNLARFEPVIQNPFDNQYYLNYLTDAEACEVITKPAAQWKIGFEPKLIEKLLLDLGQKAFYPPHIQLVCHSLYEALRPGEKSITYRLYQTQGGTTGILGDYLERVLKELPREQRTPARRLLEAFITSNNQRTGRTLDQLVAKLVPNWITTETLHSILSQLVRRRLLRRFEESDTDTYELAHDYLVETINLDPEVQTRKAVREMLEHEVRDYQDHGTLLSQDKLRFIEAQIDTLEIQVEAQDLLVRSAVYLDHNPDYWLETYASPELRTTILTEALTSSDNPTLRRRAAALAGRFGGSGLSRLLGGLMQADPDPQVRQSTALSLACINNSSFMPRLKPIYNDARRRHFALEAIDYIQVTDPELLGPHQLAQLDLWQWRLRWLRLKRNRTRRNLFTLYAAVGGSIGCAIGGLIGALLDSGIAAEEKLFAVVFAVVLGLVIGAGAGFGFGVIEAIEERSNSFWHVAGAALGGGIVGSVFGLGDPRLQHALLGAIIGLVAGAISGGLAAIIINLTASIVKLPPRLTTRLALGLIASMMAGGIFALGIQLGPIPGQGLYGFGLGLLTVGVVGGWEFVERRLNQPDRRRETN